MDFSKRIYILDGAMGTSLQRRGLRGNNDMFNITHPEVVAEIHREYVAAGADIITTNTFNSNALSQTDYGCEKRVREMARAGAQIARGVADEANAARGLGDARVWVAGSMGPTSKSLSLSPDGDHPEKRAVDFDTMAAAYREQIEGLKEGGVDLLLVETIFDGLNAKAALWAAADSGLPVMISATVNDRGGRLLTGQSVESLYTALQHAHPVSFGLNCSFGAAELMPFVERVAEWVPCAVSVYPNAGLPNEMGGYDETPETTARQLRLMAEKGLLNIAGGCCGTTPEHIRAVAEALRGIEPRKLKEPRKELIVSGLDTVIIDPSRNFTNIGERTNVAGSAAFRKLIEAQAWDDAAAVARRQIEDGAAVIDINMDDAMLDGAASMTTFLRHIAGEADIARAAVMIDSSDWATIQAGLRNAAGKCIVNSISLKEGTEKFLQHAGEVRCLGAAAVVMAFDEQGQADTFARKIEIASRAYNLLIDNGFAPQDIIFDVNVLAVGTGMAEHANYGVDFIEAVRWIKANLPGARTSAGVSNLSFAFRGNNAVREAMHSAFLFHAIAAGLDMAIVNPSSLRIYDQIDPQLLEAVEDVVLNRRSDATERLLELAPRFAKGAAAAVQTSQEWRGLPLRERLTHALVGGVRDYLSDDIAEALSAGMTPVQIIEEPLMQGMERVGKLFGEGKMFLPQVVKSARTMREAVAVLQPLLGGASVRREHKMVLATVKGDVHDIGKNIVRIVLECNGIEVVDLGVMVPNEQIVEAVLAEKPDFVGVSGLITPSLAEMERLCVMLSEAGVRVPLFVGGATTSGVHTAVKLAPLYKGVVVHGGDASRTAGIIGQLVRSFDETVGEIRAEQARVLTLYEWKRSEELTRSVILSEAKDLKANRHEILRFAQDDAISRIDLAQLFAQDDAMSKIDWSQLLHFWGFKGTLEKMLKNPEAAKTLAEARRMLARIIENDEFEVDVRVGIFGAHQENDDIVLDNDVHRVNGDINDQESGGISGVRLPMFRQKAEPFLSLADWAAPRVGLFCLKVEDKLPVCDCLDYDHLLRQSLAARMAEACAAQVQEQTGAVIRPAFGYPSCPDHSLKKVVVELLQAPVGVTEGYSLVPSTSVCGMLIFHPQARYF